MGIWWEAAGITDTSKPVDDETIERLHEAFPKTSLRGIVDRYRAQHYGHPTPSIYTLIDLALKANRPLTDQRPSKSGIAIEFKDNEYGRMGIARDKRTGQTWMWPPEEENDANEEFGVAPDDKADAFVSYRTVDGRRKTIKEMIEDIDDAEKKLGYSPTWSGPTTRRVEYGLDRYKAHRIEGLDRRDVRRALKEELERGGLPEDFHYPCHTDEGTVWCDWDCTQDRTEIMLKTQADGTRNTLEDEADRLAQPQDGRRRPALVVVGGHGRTRRQTTAVIPAGPSRLHRNNERIIGNITITITRKETQQNVLGTLYRPSQSAPHRTA